MKFPLLLIGVSSIVFAANPVQADDTETTPVLISTASRIPIAIKESGSAVTLITRDDIESLQVTHLADLLRGVQGLAISRSGPNGALTQLRMRGAEANHVLVLIDGVEVNDPGAGDEFQFEHLTLDNIESVEIVRGPQSALWGSDAVAGVIYITTIKGADELAFSGSLEAGSFDTVRGHTNVSGGGKAHRFSLGASFTDSAGTNVSRTGDENDGYDNRTLTGSFSWTPSPGVRVNLAGRHMVSDQEFDPVDWATGLPTDGDRLTESKKSSFHGALEFDGFGGRLRQKFSASWLKTENRNMIDGIFDTAALGKKVGVSAQSSATLVDGHVLTVAIDHEIQDFTQVGIAGFFGDPNQDQRLTTTGYVAEYRGRVITTLSFSGSMRHDRNSDFGNVTTFRVAGNYWNAETGTRVFANFGEGQKAPTFIERFGFTPDTFLGNPDLRPESSRGWEIGGEQTLLNDTVTLTATWFNQRLRDEINGFAFDPATFRFTAENRDGISHRKGLELGLKVTLADVTASAQYTYTKSDEPDGLGGQQPELRRPEHMGAINLTWRGTDKFSLTTRAAITGENRDIFFPPWPMPSEIVMLKSHVLVTLAAQYKVTPSATLTARIENLGDDTYEDVFGFATPGIAAYAGLRLAL